MEELKNIRNFEEFKNSVNESFPEKSSTNFDSIEGLIQSFRWDGPGYIIGELTDPFTGKFLGNYESLELQKILEDYAMANWKLNKYLKKNGYEI
jgi:hypothetical protein